MASLMMHKRCPARYSYIGRTIMDAARSEVQYSTEFQVIDRQWAVPGV